LQNPGLEDNKTKEAPTEDAPTLQQCTSPKRQVTTASTSTLWTISYTYTCQQFIKYITATNHSRFTSFPKNTHKIQSQETIFFTTKTHDWH